MELLGPSDELPPIFLQSVYSGAPFETCLQCGCELRQSNRPHAVERVVRSGEVIYEYALCSDCVLQILGEYSQESVERICSYLRFHKTAIDRDLMELRLWLAGTDPVPIIGSPTSPPEPTCSRCARRAEGFAEEHSVSGLFVGKRLFTGASFICGPCAEGVYDVLSKKTKDCNEDFIRRNFPGVPANLDLPVGVIGM
ncbi:MAG TPA: hypothetical protein PKA37_07155 [Planctomycetota bacterium]|jgi:hypothetical protein|nr:hypothetical protein [Planctomycetota bacterium]